MEREQRLRFVGILFYAVLVLHLALTREGSELIQTMLTEQPDSTGVVSDQPDLAGLVPALVGLGVVFFSSEAFGYLLSSITQSLWNLLDGYSGVWKRKLFTNLRCYIVDCYSHKLRSAEQPAGKRIPQERLKKYNLDVLLNYFWQTCPERLIIWAEHRATAFLVGSYAVTAIALADLLACLLVGWRGLGWTSCNTVWLIVTIGFLALIIWNACCAYKELWQVIDLWQGRLFDPILHSVLRTAGHRLIRDELASSADKDSAHLPD